jgi:quinol monooxygenase YgiN
MVRTVLVLLAASFAFAQPKSAEKPLYIVTYVDVYPNFAADAATAMKQFASDSLKDGATRFEVLRDVQRVNHFAIVEVWPSKEVYEKHLSAPYAKPFRDKLQPMLGSPYDERMYNALP